MLKLNDNLMMMCRMVNYVFNVFEEWLYRFLRFVVKCLEYMIYVLFY